MKNFATAGKTIIDLVRESLFNFSLDQQRIILYLIASLSPDDEEFKQFKQYKFSIPEICRVCGIDAANDVDYENLKNSIKLYTIEMFGL